MTTSSRVDTITLMPPQRPRRDVTLSRMHGARLTSLLALCCLTAAAGIIMFNPRVPSGTNRLCLVSAASCLFIRQSWTRAW